MDHRRLKAEVYDVIKAAPGWRADLEVRADNGEWIADVMATSISDGKRVAFEIQLSPQDRRWAEERQRRRTKDRIDCLWLVGPSGHGPKGATAHLLNRTASQAYIGSYTGRTNHRGPIVERDETDLARIVGRYLDNTIRLTKDLEHPLPVDSVRNGSPMPSMTTSSCSISSPFFRGTGLPSSS